MEKIVQRSWLLFGIAITAFGVENLICARLGLAVRGVPWFPGNPFLAAGDNVCSLVLDPPFP